jgi:hypothetical protein
MVKLYHFRTKYSRLNFDIDIMHVLDKEVVYVEDFGTRYIRLLNEELDKNKHLINRDHLFDISMTNARQLWNLPENCKHLDEPWIFHPMKSVTKFPTEHIGLTRPTCPKCIDWCSEFNDMLFQKHLDFEERKMKIISHTSATFDF